MTEVAQRIRKLSALKADKVPQLAALKEQMAEAQGGLEKGTKGLEPLQFFLDNADIIESNSQQLFDIKRDLARTEDSYSEAFARHEAVNLTALREQKALKFYASVLDDLTAEYVQKLEDALNEVYLFVFQNPNKRVKLMMDDKYNKKVLVLRLVNTFGEEVHIEGLEDSGYSVSVVLGTVLLVYFILYNNLEKVVFFDEAISGLSADTALRFSSLLRAFIDESGFKFLMISHESRYAEFADRTYSVRGGRFTLESHDEP